MLVGNAAPKRCVFHLVCTRGTPCQLTFSMQAHRPGWSSFSSAYGLHSRDSIYYQSRFINPRCRRKDQCYLRRDTTRARQEQCQYWGARALRYVARENDADHRAVQQRLCFIPKSATPGLWHTCSSPSSRPAHRRFFISTVSTIRGRKVEDGCVRLDANLDLVAGCLLPLVQS